MVTVLNMRGRHGWCRPVRSYIGRPVPRVRLCAQQMGQSVQDRAATARETESSPNIVLGFCGGRS
jgi:hypothetical protein